MSAQDLFGPMPKRTHYGNGYPAAPGTGPEGKQCRHCSHWYIKRIGRKISKCGLVTSTTGTDISMYSPACRRFNESAT